MRNTNLGVKKRCLQVLFCLRLFEDITKHTYRAYRPRRAALALPPERPRSLYMFERVMCLARKSRITVHLNMYADKESHTEGTSKSSVQ